MTAPDPRSAIKYAESGAGEKHTIDSGDQVVWMSPSGAAAGYDHDGPAGAAVVPRGAHVRTQNAAVGRHEPGGKNDGAEQSQPPRQSGPASSAVQAHGPSSLFGATPRHANITDKCFRHWDWGSDLDSYRPRQPVPRCKS